jgi:hypothetical protein
MRGLKWMLATGAALSAAMPATAQDLGQVDKDIASTAEDRGWRGDRETFRAARREARQQGRVVAEPVPAPQAAVTAPGVTAPEVEAIRQRMRAVNEGAGVRDQRWRGRDRDGDGVPNRGDRDRDNDGRPNWRDGDANNDGRRDWRWRDRDRDGVPNARDRDRDNDGRPNWRDGDANSDGRRDWRWRDHDRDGVPNRRDWDRDGDGRPNWRDGRHRHDPWRYWKRPRPRYVIVRPSPSYRYHPYWWGSSYYLFDDRYDRYGYDYGAYYRPGDGYYGGQYGSGWATLYSWLRRDPAARHWVMWYFDDNRNGRLGKEEARDANRAFDRLADRNRDGYVSDREVRWALDELRDEYRYSYRFG